MPAKKNPRHEKAIKTKRSKEKRQGQKMALPLILLKEGI
jgi:hypothetical protein